MKKLISVILSMAMVLCMAMTGFAETTYTITINNSAKGHTYEAYQIFSGELSTNESGKKVLSNIQWGSGVTNDAQTKFGDASAKAEDLTESNVKDFAKKVASCLSGTKYTSTEGTGTYTIEVTEPGYYLIKDKDNSISENDSYTEYLLKVVSNVTATPKSDIPSVEKKVDDKNDSYTTEDEIVWQDSADYDMGDKVPFKLTANLPNNVEEYTTYKVVFHDTLSKGLTYADNMKIVIQNTKEDGTVEDIDVTEKINKENGFSVSTEIITNEDNEKETKLTISCDNVKALGATNNSKIIVTYDATLNEDAVIGSAGNTNDVYLEYSNNPNQSGEGTPETGKTPEDTVIVFTYKTIVNKVDENNAPLAGAKFELYKIFSDNSELLINRVTISEDQTSFTFTGLDDGKYVLKETVTPDGYNTIDDIHFEIMATHTVGLDSLNGETESGIVKINNIDFTVDKGEGSYSTDVINNSGATLPETGGIGTKIFYVVGAALVIGAGVLLITRKRMSAR